MYLLSVKQVLDDMQYAKWMYLKVWSKCQYVDKKDELKL